MKLVRIITKEKVDKTFENVSCRVLRTILSVTKTLNRYEFKIITEYCNYEDKVVPRLDSEGNRQYGPTGELLVTTIQDLQILGKKDKESIVVVDVDGADMLYMAIRNNVILEDSYSSFIQQVEQQALLFQTLQDNPYGYGLDKWVVLNED